MTSDIVNGGIAVGAALFLTFPSNLFNQTFEENYADISAWWQKWLGIFLPERWRRRLAEGFRKAKAWLVGVVGLAGRAVNKQHELQWAGPVAVVLAGSLLGSLLDPSFGPDVKTLISYVAIIIAMVTGVALSGFVTGTYHRARRHGRVPFKPEALPMGLLVAAACVVVSRLTGFEPGYLYGVICGISFSRELAQREEGHVVALNSLIRVAIGVVAWFIWDAVNRYAWRGVPFSEPYWLMISWPRCS